MIVLAGVGASKSDRDFKTPSSTLGSNFFAASGSISINRKS